MAELAAQEDHRLDGARGQEQPPLTVTRPLEQHVGAHERARQGEQSVVHVREPETPGLAEHHRGHDSCAHQEWREPAQLGGVGAGHVGIVARVGVLPCRVFPGAGLQGSPRGRDRPAGHRVRVMTSTPVRTASDLDRTTPTEQLLTAGLLVAPVVYLAADTTYAARGWDDPIAGVLHVLGGIAYGLIVLRVASWVPTSLLASAIVLTGLIGLAGNVAYGFETIHLSLGDTPLVDQPGAATLIKPLGLFFPLSFALVSFALSAAGAPLAGSAGPGGRRRLARGPRRQHRAGRRAVNVALVVAFGSLAWPNGRPARLDPLDDGR